MLRENCLESKKLATATHAACNLWFRLLVKVDDYGNFLDDSAVIKTACFLWRAGMKNSFVKELIDELQSVGLLSRYEVNNERFIHLERFEDFQELRYEKVARFPRLLEPCNPPTEVSTPPCPPAKSNRGNKSSDEVKSKRSEGKAAPNPVWKETGVDPAGLPGPFRKLCEELYAKRNGQSLAEFVGVCMDGWQALGEKKQPREFVQAATRIREEAKNPPAAPIRPLPDMPFQEKKVGQCQTKS